MNVRKLFICLLILCLLPGCLPARAFAEEAETPAFVDEEELTAIIRSALEESHGAGAQVSVAVLFTRTGEEYYLNGDDWYYTASVYKLPMIMRYTRMLADGELPEGIGPVFTEQADMIRERILVYSDNSWAAALWENVFTEPGSVVDAAVDFAQFPREELPRDFYQHTIFSPRLTLGILKELYQNPEQYPGVLDYMKQAQPGQYFRTELEGVYEVAQKYGSDEGYNHTAGIIYTPSPILLVVMSRYLGSVLADRMIGHVAAAVAAYALTVDERADAWEQAHSAAAGPEPTPTPEPTPEPMPEPTPEPTAAPEVKAAPEPRARLYGIGLAAIPLAAVAVWGAARKKKKKS